MTNKSDSQHRVCVALLLMLYFFGVSTSQNGIPGTLRLSDEDKNSTHVRGTVEMKLDDGWYRICIHGEVSAKDYLNPTCTKLGYSTAGKLVQLRCFIQ